MAQKIAECVHGVIQEHARNRPLAQAVCAWDGSLTNAELEMYADHLARQLQIQGVGPESFVCFSFEKSMAVVVAIIAIMKAGAACVPLDIS